MKKFSLIVAFAICISAVFGQTTPSQQLPEALQPLVGSAELLADQLLRLKSGTLSVSMSSNAQVGQSEEKRMFLNGTANEMAIVRAINNASVGIRVSSVTESIGLSVNVSTTDGRFSIYGYDSKIPVANGAAYTLPVFKIRLRISGTPVIAYPGTDSVKLTIYDQSGRVSDYRYLNTVDGGFEFPADAAGQGTLEIIKKDGKVEVWDVRKGGSSVTSHPVSLAGLDIGIDRVETVEDRSELMLIPETNNGIGYNVLGQIIASRTLVVQLAGRTTENAPASQFKVRRVLPSVTAYQTVIASSGGLASVTVEAGQYDVVPVFSQGLREPTFSFPRQ